MVQNSNILFVQCALIHMFFFFFFFFLFFFFFRKWPVCALIGACALIRTSTVNIIDKDIVQYAHLPTMSDALGNCFKDLFFVHWDSRNAKKFCPQR